ncbi:transcriptional regulator NosR [Thiohalophilus sp.]|uniref:transcriptional regulator NosR n=1 Tax=Thiohalophilus sp. TaxID=3028392 RepID=UPI002ACD42B5|nr:4Fe-4S binding protein [Thiohalophilus sp.]MDZ7661311.1 4Fe-4S binding protein [Thiohalophilus sp.]
MTLGQIPQYDNLIRRGLLSLVTIALLLILPLSALAGFDDKYPQIRDMFPEADRFGELEGEPPAAAVYKDDEVIGYVFESSDSVKIPAYSGKPVNLLIGIDMQGLITGTRVIEHHEPILLVGIPEESLDRFADQYIGHSVTERIKVGGREREGRTHVDAITGATVTVIVINRTILRSARKVSESRGITSPRRSAAHEPAKVREEVFEQADWTYLTGNGAIRRMLLSNEDVEEAFKGTEAEDRGNVKSICTAVPTGERCDIFIDLYYTYLNAPTIGRNLLGESQYNRLMAELKPSEHAIAVMANGNYSFKGSGYVRGGIFDRINLAQGDQQISFRDLDYYRLQDVYLEGAPELSEKAIFIIRDQYAFDPGEEWSISLLVRRATGPLDSTFTDFTASYEIPPKYVTQPPPAEAAEEEPMWVEVWYDRTFQIVILAIGLVVLTLILFLQDWLVRYPRLVGYLRTGFLLYTLFVIGWYMLGQLSIVNVLTFVSSLISGFSWESFLIDPVMFILWSFVAVTLLLWGRGIYCGWLCPFGALQKLVNQVAVKFKVPQYNFPSLVHDRLWAVKYIILLALFGISLGSLSTAEYYAEVEPFKTAITLRFDRQWPFFLYAFGLVVISAFNCKFYCKYLCPLGAALAVPARLRLFDWLRRRKECGHPCQICANECEIQAIHDTGEINVNECHFCLDCQVTYWDSHKCPPLVDRRRKHEKAARTRQQAQWMEKASDTQTGMKAAPLPAGNTSENDK